MQKAGFALLIGFLLVASTQASYDCFMKYPGRALYQHNNKVIDDVTIELCKYLCLSEQEFVCLSFDYTLGVKVCFLSSENSTTQEAWMGRHNKGVYFERISCPEGECKDSWLAFGDHCYHITADISLNKSQAQTFCENRDSNLLAMETEEEYNFIISTVADVQRSGFSLWWTAGHGTLMDDGKTWVWEWTFQTSGVLNSVPMEFQPWVSQSTRGRQTKMNVLLLGMQAQYGLIRDPDTDRRRASPHPFICEKTRR